MRVPLLFWLAWQIIKYTFLFLRWLFRSAVDCINNQGWWKSTAAVLACTIAAYLFVSAVRPDVSQNWRDDWRSFFRNAPRITVIITTPTPQPTSTSTTQATIPAQPTNPTAPTPETTAPPILVPKPTPTITLIPSPSPTPETIAIPVATPTSAPSGLTKSELADAREYALTLINQARTAVNLNEVVLGDNTAAQSHAEDQRVNCVSGHWGTDGLKPYMRYTLASGEQYSAENVSGIDFCPTDPDRYATISITSEIDEAMNGLLSSPGHVRNILDPYHRKVNIGVSYQSPNLWLVQLFVGDYVEYVTQPKINEGRLTLSGATKNGARIDGGRLNVTISWDQTPRPLTRGQLHHTGCVSGGSPIAALNPLDSYSAYEISGNLCADPYEVPTNAPTATSYFDEPNVPLPKPFNREVSLIPTDQWQTDNNNFVIEADLNELIQHHGDGVYTINLWADINGDEVLISEYSIFIPQLRQDQANVFAYVTPTPAPTLTPTPTQTPAPTFTPSPTIMPTSAPSATPIPTATSTTTPTVAPTASPVPTATPTPTSTPTPVPIPPSGLTQSELAAAREYALTLINQARTASGLYRVTLDDNTAAQSHAEDMQANCFLSHWGTDGLKPYMRYTLTGGEQYSAENVSGIGFCPANPDRYLAKSITAELDEAMHGLLNSPGHLRNILNPNHRKVGVGISYQRPNLWLVQLFVGDYTRYSAKPKIEDGILSLAGAAINGAMVSGRSLGIQIYYDQPSYPLTRGQLHNTTCGNNGRIIASIREPPGPNSYYTTHAYSQSGTRCRDPYNVPTDTPPASSYFDPKVGGTVPYQHNAVWITAAQWASTATEFAVSANISNLLDQHGNGVYTIVVWAEISGDRTPISEYSIFIPPHPPVP